jgi:predicted dehydrogenase
VKPYRAAIIGTGSFADVHARILKEASPRVELVAAADIDEARVAAFCTAHAIPNGFTSVPDLLAAIQPDLVNIVSPPGTHCEFAIASLEAGAWVYCEKPLCVSLAEFDRIAAAEARTGRYVSTVFQWRFGSAPRHLKHLYDAGELGRFLVGVCQTLWYRGAEYYATPWRRHWADSAGGVSATMGIHLMDLFLWLMGDWKEVRAVVDTLNSPSEVEDIAMAIVRFESGALATITNSSISPRQESYLRLDFEKATVDVSGVYGYSNANWRFALPAGSSDEAKLEEWQKIAEDRGGSHTIQLAELLNCMDKNERPFVSGAEARRILEFLTSIYKSAFTGQVVQRGSILPGDAFYAAMNGAPPDSQA